MTKRFKFNGGNNCIEYDGKSILLDSYGEDIEELLNELHDELQHSERHLDMLRQHRDKLLEDKKELKKEIETIHTMLDNAILLERTRMGQNALKQFKEAIQ